MANISGSDKQAEALWGVTGITDRHRPPSTSTSKTNRVEENRVIGGTDAVSGGLPCFHESSAGFKHC